MKEDRVREGGVKKRWSEGGQSKGGWSEEEME